MSRITDLNYPMLYKKSFVTCQNYRPLISQTSIVDFKYYLNMRVLLRIFPRSFRVHWTRLSWFYIEQDTIYCLGRANRRMQRSLSTCQEATAGTFTPFKITTVPPTAAAANNNSIPLFTIRLSSSYIHLHSHKRARN